MTKLLTLDEMAAVLLKLDFSTGKVYAELLESVGTTMAKAIADKLDVEYNDAKYEPPEFGGVCAGFEPKTPGQPCPSPLDEYDSTEWGDED